MKYISWAFRILIFIVLLGFALKNTDPVHVRFYLGGEWQAPLVFVLLIAFVLGALGGVAASLGHVFRQRREMLALRKQLRSQSAGQTRED